MGFQAILDKYRKFSFSERDKGGRFERLMQAYLKTDPVYAGDLKSVWLWNDFPGRKDFGGKDIGIDLVALTHAGDYWAIQCKCFAEGTCIDKGALDSFLSTSSKTFLDEQFQTTHFSRRLWIDTAGNWGPTAEATIRNQHPPVSRISLHQLIEARIDWEKLEANITGDAARLAQRDILPHQKVALEKTIAYFKDGERGKLIMACGTGKTFTSLRIAEAQTGNKGFILFLVPSIALLGQTLREWADYAQEKFHPICICSDSDVSKKKTKNEDGDSMSVVDLAAPASTDVKTIVSQLKAAQEAESGMTVVFSTYQSIEAVALAQLKMQQEGNGESIFDLIICDEAHRTAGYAISDDDASAFVKVHDNRFIQARKRLYMTATPKLYSDSAKTKAAQADAPVWSMDDAKHFGEEIHRIGFGEAVEKGLLADYKVLVLTISEADMDVAIQKAIAEDNEIKSDDLSKLVGCINALSKKMLGDAGILKDTDPEPMRRAVAFCPSIKDSKKITSALNDTQARYMPTLDADVREGLVTAVADHVDGTMGATVRDQKLSWLKGAPDDSNECRILTNVRCLSEGVDVPSLDSVMFLSSRNSEVDVVQSVGRVMRTAPGKKYGYIIIPVVVPTYVEPDKALDDNERYKVVWTVLNALRAHDDRFNATINKIELNKKKPSQILVGRPDYRGSAGYDSNEGSQAGNSNEGDATYQNRAPDFRRQMELEFEKLQDVLFARMVLKVGSKRYWEQWAKNVAEIAERQVERINRIIREEGTHRAAFQNFLAGLQRNINPGITQQEAVEMLSQHVITKPVFEALFEGYSFVQHNPISVSMQQMMNLLEAASVEQDTETLQKFYDSVRKRAAGIDNAEGKQRIIIELYDKFFKTAFPKMVEQLGIVYTPVEVVDFIIHSVADVLESEFGRSISDENVHILDPFTGTGTFITRLLQSGRILPKDLHRKYTREIHANEIVLLAYYIAAVNIENAFHDALAEALDAEVPYEAFEGICLTDTFQLGETEESEKLFSEMFPQNSERVAKQKKAPLRVIIGNPPYSVGQKSANDNAQNQKYEKLDSRIANTYAAATKATNKNSLYDSYIKAFRWSTDRLDPKHGGIVCFVSNGAWIDGNAQDGFRKYLEDEFSSIYVFNLRGNQRTSGELSREEGGKIFGSGSRTPIAITLLVKNPLSQKSAATIHYHDIGDYLSREDKLAAIRKFGSVRNQKLPWQQFSPNEAGDWVNHRNDLFADFIPIGDKDDKKGQSFFVPFYSNGVKTQRDAWCYNSSKTKLGQNVQLTLATYNEQRKAFHEGIRANAKLDAKTFLSRDSTRISWTRALEWDVEKNREHSYEAKNIVVATYRPFFKQYLYFSRSLNEMVYQMPKLFPTSGQENRLICLPGPGGTRDFSTLIEDCIRDLDTYGGVQCFPLYYYEPREASKLSLFDNNAGPEYIRRDGISDFILQRAQKQYGKTVSKEDIFYYVYGILHSPQYRTTFAADLKKMLPRLPLVEEPRDFWKYSKAGRALAELHMNYEKVPPYEGVTVSGDNGEHYRVEKMRFPKKGEKDSIIYNSRITVSNIPAEAYEYVVNGKSAIEWVMERYAITTHKESGITNDPNDWAAEVGNPRYILDLLLSVINVSVQTVEIVKGLPALTFDTTIQNKEQHSTTVTIEPMRPNSPFDGIYSVQDVARFMRLSEPRIRAWFKRLKEHGYEGLSEDFTDPDTMLLNFYGVFELIVIYDLNLYIDDKGKERQRIPLTQIFEARRWLKEKFDKPYPFAFKPIVNTIAKGGSSIVFKAPNSEELLEIGKGGNVQLLLSLIKSVLTRIRFGDDDVVSRIYSSDSKLIAIDPKLGGLPAVVSTGVTVEMIKSTFSVTKDVSATAKQWEVSDAEVKESLALEAVLLAN